MINKGSIKSFFNGNNWKIVLFLASVEYKFYFNPKNPEKKKNNNCLTSVCVSVVPSVINIIA